MAILKKDITILKANYSLIISEDDCNDNTGNRQISNSDISILLFMLLLLLQGQIC